MYCRDKNPLASIRTDTLFDSNRALVEGFIRDVLYLHRKMKQQMQRYVAVGHLTCNYKVVTLSLNCGTLKIFPT